MKPSTIVLLTVAALLFAGPGLAAPPYMQTDTAFYPYAPSLLKWEKTGADFTEPETCGECHPEKYEQWQGSMHAMAFQDPIYQGELYLAVTKAGHDTARQCEGCHTPAAVVKGEIKGAGLKGLSPLAMAGVSCDVCHSVKGHTHWQTPYHQPENGSLILSPGTADQELTKYGPLAPDEWCGEEFHACVESKLHTSSELCASCHQVFNHRTHTPLEATYQEWKNSPYSTKSIHCQDCHMVDTKTFKRSADELVRPELAEYRHFFNGANLFLYKMTALAAEKNGNKDLAANALEKYEMALARLKAAAELAVFPVYRNGGLAEIRIRVKNIRAGHNLPTSLTNIRQMWLEVTAAGPDGKVLLSTGTPDQKGKLAKGTRIFNTRGQDGNLNFSIYPWEIETFSQNETIPPKGFREVVYGLALKKGIPVTVHAKLRFRQAAQEIAEKLLRLVPDPGHLEKIYGIKEIPLLPVIDMTETRVVINTP
ncbi:MAG: cytochrome C [Desulfobacteraceae bacterium]|nr:cytochrome C [Desulfobacteraceae bacterium]